MNTDQDLRSIWLKQQTAALPAEKELLKRARQIKAKERNVVVFTFLLLTATATAISFIVHFAKPQLLTTKIGTALVLLAIFTYLAASGRSLQLVLKRDRQGTSVREYLGQLMTIRARQRFLQQTIMSVYFILLSAGIFLYMIEYAAKMSTTGALLAYGLTVLWFGFNWLYMRPRIIRKQSARLNEVIARLEEINGQY
jgi:hypothetical protein